MNDRDLIYKEECYQIIGACFEVYKEKGSGLDEPLYQECLEMELLMADSRYPTGSGLARGQC